MFPLGESGQLNYVGTLVPAFDPNYFTMVPAYDPFMPRPFSGAIRAIVRARSLM